MSICSECVFYDPIEPDKNGKCKCHSAVRHMSLRDPLNGWPEVESDGKACGDFAAE